MADKVVHIADPIAAADISRSRGVVTIVFKDGSSISHTVEDMLGTSRNPAPVSVYIEKFRANVAGVIPDARADELIAEMMTLETVTSLGSVLAPLRERL